MLLAGPAQFVVGWTFHIRALRALRRGRANMDVLVSVGTNAAFAYSMLSVAYQKAHPGAWSCFLLFGGGAVDLI